MSVLVWDEVGTRTYETGVDHGVLYIPDNAGVYNDGVAWNGLVSVTESPSGAASNPQYADNIKYLDLISAEQFGGTIEAFTYPDAFAQFDGLSIPTPGVVIGQQSRRSFGLSFRTKLGNDVQGDDYGYKLHLLYGATASPSERAYHTISDSPAAITFSWAISTTPVSAGGTLKPTSILTIDSSKVNAAALASLEQILYGSAGVDPALPLPATVIAMFSGTITPVTPTQPAYNGTTHVITIPTVTGVSYYINGVVVPAGNRTITADTVVTARPNPGYIFTTPGDDDWFYDYV